MQIAVACENLCCKRLIQFNRPVVFELRSGARQKLSYCRHRRNAHHARINRGNRRVDNARKGLKAKLAHFFLAGQHDARRAVSDSARVASAHGSCLTEYRRQLCHLFARDVWPHVFVFFYAQHIALLVRAIDGNHFGAEPAVLQGARRATMAFDGERVLLLAGNFVLLREQLRCFAHDHLRNGAQKSVAVHGIDQRLVAHFHAPARVHQIGPARHAICRAGLGPTPAGRALPKISSSTCQATSASAAAGWPEIRSGGSGAPNARSSAARTAITPKSGAVNSASPPPNLPIGVRTALTMYTVPFFIFVFFRPFALATLLFHTIASASIPGIRTAFCPADIRRAQSLERNARSSKTSRQRDLRFAVRWYQNVLNLPAYRRCRPSKAE